MRSRRQAASNIEGVGRCRSRRWVSVAPPVLDLAVAWILVGFVAACAACGGTMRLKATRSVSPPVRTVTGSSGAATLGGTLADFDARYGMPVNGDGDARWTYDMMVDAHRVEVGVTVLPTPGGARRVAIISVGPPPSSTSAWDLATALRIARAFVPADSVLVGTHGVGTPVTYVYRSAWLAAVFPASRVPAMTQRPVPAGTFDERCFPALSGTGIGQCLLALSQLVQ